MNLRLTSDGAYPTFFYPNEKPYSRASFASFWFIKGDQSFYWSAGCSILVYGLGNGGNLDGTFLFYGTTVVSYFACFNVKVVVWTAS
jgi:hypothetical protein